MNRRAFLARIRRLAAAAAGSGVLVPPLLCDGLAKFSSGGTVLTGGTVVDMYSACVDVPQLDQGGIQVVVQAVTAEEMFVQIPPQGMNEPPPPGFDVWEHVFKGPDVVERVLQGIDEELAGIERNKSRIALAQNFPEVSAVVASGKIALILMLKSGWIHNDLAVLRMYYRLGIRVLAPCHLAAFDWADSYADLNAKPGLSAFGRDVVKECNRLGILVDVSHASDKTAWDTIETSSRTVIASHTKCRAISKSYRDLTDDMIRAIARKGGVIGILAARPRTSAEALQARLRRDNRLRTASSDPFARGAGQRADPIVWGTDLDLVHIDHVVKLAGIDSVGLASHCTSVPQWREYAETLLKHGYSEIDAKKILGQNALRVYREVLASNAGSV